MDEIKFLSLVIPAYKQEKIIIRNIKNLDRILSTFPFRYEIIVVIDGIVNGTYKKAKRVENKRIKVYGYNENHGKGYAVRHGVRMAQGDMIGFIDAGMDIDPNGISMLLNHMIWYNADIIVGSKLHPVSQVDYPIIRKILSWGYRKFTHILFGFKVRDTQVGLKFFKRRIVQDVFPRLLVKQFAFDVELLAVAHALGHKRIYEAPVKLKFSGTSSITSSDLWGMQSIQFWKTIFWMLWDTLAVFYRLNILRYYHKRHRNLRRSWTVGVSE